MIGLKLLLTGLLFLAIACTGAYHSNRGWPMLVKLAIVLSALTGIGLAIPGALIAIWSL